MESIAVFWIITIVMAVVACSFLAAPFIKNDRRVGLIAISVALPVFAAGLYWTIGSPQAASRNDAAGLSIAVKPGVQSAAQKSVGSVASMVDGLVERLRQNPDDGKSWLLLARSYKFLNRPSEAQDAYARAAALGEYAADLETVSEPENSSQSAVAQVVGNIRLSERSGEIVLPTDTVFIFARAVGGPPMPVAVLRRPVSDLPLDFLLDDSLAISAEAKLSDCEQVVVTARISRSGAATDALQGLEAKSEALIVAENRHLNLVID